MLVLSRRVGEQIQIGEHVAVTVVRIAPGVVRIGVAAPAEMSVMREELRAKKSEAEQCRCFVEPR